MAAVLFVRVKSKLDEKELERRALERKPEFLKIPGLIQKVYGKDPSTGDACGIYFFESKEALGHYVQTELAKTIPSAYEAIEIRKEVYDVMFPLYPDRGPMADWNE